MKVMTLIFQNCLIIVRNLSTQMRYWAHAVFYLFIALKY